MSDANEGKSNWTHRERFGKRRRVAYKQEVGGKVYYRPEWDCFVWYDPRERFYQMYEPLRGWVSPVNHAALIPAEDIEVATRAYFDNLHRAGRWDQITEPIASAYRRAMTDALVNVLAPRLLALDAREGQVQRLTAYHIVLVDAIEGYARLGDITRDQASAAFDEAFENVRHGDLEPLRTIPARKE